MTYQGYMSHNGL